MKLSIEKDLKRIVDVFWDIEKRYWEEAGTDDEHHIFLSLNRVKNWLEANREKDSDEEGKITL